MGVLRARRALRVGPWITLASYPPPYLRLLVIYKMTGLLGVVSENGKYSTLAQWHMWFWLPIETDSLESRILCRQETY